MRSWSVVALVCFGLTASAIGRADEALDQLVKRADAAPEHQKAALYTEIAGRQLQTADALYNSGHTEEARAAIANVVTYSEKAAEASAHAASRLKQTEIALRKMAAKLRDIQRGLSFEDQKPVEEAANRLEKLRTELLARMFGKGDK